MAQFAKTLFLYNVGRVITHFQTSFFQYWTWFKTLERILARLKNAKLLIMITNLNVEVLFVSIFRGKSPILQPENVIFFRNSLQ